VGKSTDRELTEPRILFRDPVRTRPAIAGVKLKAAISRRKKPSSSVPPRSNLRGFTKSTPRPGRSSTPAATTSRRCSRGDPALRARRGARSEIRHRGVGVSAATAWLTIARSRHGRDAGQGARTPFKPPSASHRSSGVILGLARYYTMVEGDSNAPCGKASGRATFSQQRRPLQYACQHLRPPETAHRSPARHGRRLRSTRAVCRSPALGPPVDLCPGAMPRRRRFCGRHSDCSRTRWSWPVCSLASTLERRLVARLGRLARDDSAVEPY